MERREQWQIQGTALPGAGRVRGARWGWGLLQQLNLGAERQVQILDISL